MPDDRITYAETAKQLFATVLGGIIGRLFDRDSLVKMRVKRLAYRKDRLNPMPIRTSFTC